MTLLRLTLPDHDSVFASSDHHFGHTNIIRFDDRPFNSIGHMNAELVARHNMLVGERDVFFALGDLALGTFAESLEHASRLNGIKYLVPGNHDRVSSVFDRGRNIARFQAMYEDAGFIVLPEEGVTVDIGGATFQLSHYPYSGDHTDRDRHVNLRPADTGLPLLHGHIHNHARINGRQFNVGVSVNGYAPVTEEQILDFAHGVR